MDGDHDFAAGSKALRQLVDSTPIIDNHAHPLLKRSQAGKRPLLSITSEAHGDALASSRTTLAHLRAVGQLARKLGCAATWEAVEGAIAEKQRGGEAEYARWTAACLSGIECVLVDDGLDDDDEAVEPYGFFDGFVPRPSRRIARIERVAARLVEEACRRESATAEEAFAAAMAGFDAAIADALADDKVVGFKSVICYRTGLDIAAREDEAAALDAFAGIFTERRRPGAPPFTRLAHRPLNELLVHRLAQAIRDDDDDDDDDTPAGEDTPEREKKKKTKKPIQFHTGLGDNDLTLSRSSPALLQPFVRAYPGVPVVLLHAGYPFARETAYMAALYANVYADLGEVFPSVGRHGQEAALRHVLELCPWEKMLWSTDGHCFPETWFLAVAQMREVLHRVLCELVRAGDISWGAAGAMAEDMLFHTSNRLYGLGLVLERRPASEEEEGSDGRGRDGRLAAAAAEGGEPSPGEEEERRPSPSSPPAASPSHRLLALLRGPDAPRFVRLYWIDYTGTTRLRVLPAHKALSLLLGGDGRSSSRGGGQERSLTITVTKAALGLMQDDSLAAGVGATGQYKLRADPASLRLGPKPGHCMLMCDFFSDDDDDDDDDGDGPSATSSSASETPAPLCPRTRLRTALEQLATEHRLAPAFGFEIELALVRYARSGNYKLFDADGHAWSTARALEHDVVDEVLEPAVRQLAAWGLPVEMLHAESAKGQFEVVLPPGEALAAVDALVFAREVLSARATAAGYRMTLHPKPLGDGCGTAAHAHISLALVNHGVVEGRDGGGGGGDDDDDDGSTAAPANSNIRTSTRAPPPPSPSVPRPLYESFYGGILTHLRALCAFTHGSLVSYERVRDGAWAGGTWVAWGTQNRETPLRKIRASHWEVRCIDGLANPYLAMAGLVLAGARGLAAGEKLPCEDCRADPASLSWEERLDLGINSNLPASIGEALACLDRDEELAGAMGHDLVQRYLRVKEAETRMLEGMGEDARKKWIIDRY